MTEILSVIKKNESFLKVSCDPGIGYEIKEFFSFQVPGYKFMPAYKTGRWDGFINIFNPLKSELPIGNLDQLREFCEARKYELQLEVSANYGIPDQKNNIFIEDVRDYFEELKATSNGKRLEARDYQVNGVYEALYNKRRIILSPTGSGKSNLIYTITRWVLETEEDSKVLILCPTTSLVGQMYSDFDDYSGLNDWNTEENCHKLYAGASKTSRKRVIISTWQSMMNIAKSDPSYFRQFDMVISDECHLCKSTELTRIIESCTDAKYKFGFTGSLDKSKTHKMVLLGLFGPITKVATTRQLIDQGHLSDIQITACVLSYSSLTRSAFSSSKKIDYQKEVDFLVSHDRRNKFIRNLACSLEGTVLVLTTLVEKHGKVLYDLIETKVGDTIPVRFYHGKVDVDEREEIRNFVKSSKRSITIASASSFATGTNIPNIDYIIFAAPSKSVIRVLQSIGRGLRKSEGKLHCVLYDLGDKLNSSKSKPNHTYKHLAERLKIYVEEKFEYKIIEVEIERD